VQAANEPRRRFAGWIAEREAFLRVIFSVALYASAVLLLVSVLLVGPANARTKILAAVLVVSIAGLYVIRRYGRVRRGE